MGKNYYEILEVSKDATSDEIRKAYKRLACEYHPDRNKSPDAEEKFKEISKAYKVLSEPESKSKYDQFGEEGLEGFESNFNPSSFFQQFFSGNMGNMGNFFQENNDVPPVETVIEATLEEIFTGCTKNITIERFNTCTTCNNSIKKCQKCMGNGIMRFVVNNRLQQVSCKSCNGTGRQDGKDACKKCNSIGFIKEKHLDGWQHVYQTEADLNKEIKEGRATTIRQLYDVYKTPTFYLLDANKRIVAKNLGLQQFHDFLQNAMNKKGAN